MTKVKNHPLAYQLIAIIGIILYLLAPSDSFSQGSNKNPLWSAISKLQLDSLDNGYWIYYSDGYQNRAAAISRQIHQSSQFFSDSLGISVGVKIALLDTSDYKKMPTGIPYGLPFVNNGIIMLPADTTVGSVRDLYAPFSQSTSDHAKNQLKKVGYTYSKALPYMVDLIGLHELGHTQSQAYNIYTSGQAWFNEFIASYFGYAYMKERDPKMSVIWDQIMQTGFEKYTPKHTSLDTLNKIYVGVGVGDYVWFQNSFQMIIREVYQREGLNFIRKVKTLMADTSFHPITAKDLLIELEKIVPGFLAWENSLTPSENEFTLEFKLGPAKSIHTPLYSPYGAKLELVPTDIKNIKGTEHLFGFIGVGQTSSQLDAQTFVISRKEKGRPYTLLTLDIDQDGDFGDEESIEITANESRGNYWSSFEGVELTAQYLIGGKIHQEPYPVSMWVVVEDTVETPEIIRFSRKGFRIAKIKVSDMEVAVILSDGNNDGIFNEEDWWILRPYDTKERLRDSRTVGDFAWLNGEAWKLSLGDEAGLKAKLTRFDPGITEEQDLESRDLYLADKKASKAKQPVPFSKNYEQTLALAKEENKPYFIKFEAVWCGPCKLMDKYVYASKAVVKAAQDVHCVKVDTDDYPALKQKYGVNALPTGILFDAEGNELKRFEGYRSVKAMEKFFEVAE